MHRKFVFFYIEEEGGEKDKKEKERSKRKRLGTALAFRENG